MKVDEDELYSHIAVKLEKARENLGLTQLQVAEKVSRGRTSIANIENRRQKPPLHVLYAICIALELEPSSIMPTVAQVTTAPTLVNVAITGYAPIRLPRAAAKQLRIAAEKLLEDVELNRKG